VNDCFKGGKYAFDQIYLGDASIVRQVLSNSYQRLRQPGLNRFEGAERSLKRFVRYILNDVYSSNSVKLTVL